VDITGVTPGTYTLELEIDPDHKIPESNETNNITRTTVVIKAPCTGPPPNDSFAGGLIVPYRTATSFADSECATRESGEPPNPVNAGGKSVWFRWTAPYTGTVTINTDGSNFDTILAFYRGSLLGSLTHLASDDDSGPGVTSLVAASVTAGTVYQIVVDGYNDGSGTAASGDVVLSINPGGNDLFVNCVALNGVAGTIGGTTTGTGKETLEPNHAGAVGGHSIWYCWTAPDSGTYFFDTVGSRFDTVLAVYTGVLVSTLTPVASDDDGGLNGTSRLSFNAVGGTTYRIAIDGKSGASGICTLTWRPQPRLASMAHPLGSFQFNLLTAPGERCWIDTSSNAIAWTPWLRVTNNSGNMLITDPVSMSIDRRYYKARTD
jgi:hypothetical protein